MADYSTIKGFSIQSLTSDPIATPIDAGTWAAGNNMNTARVGNAAFGGPAALTAAVTFGGGTVSLCEEYDGTSWAEVNNYPISIDSAGATGTLSAGLGFGGDPPTPGANVNTTNEYDGTSWTASNNLNTARRDLVGGGTQTAAIGSFGAIDPPFTGATETYDGTSWSSVNSGLTGRRSAAGGGTTTAALTFGGFVPPYTNLAEEYDGTSWTQVTVMNTARGVLAGTHAGTVTAMLAIGGYGPPGATYFANTEYYNGSTWSEVADMGTASNSMGAAGTSTAAIKAGGNIATGNSNLTEEWTVPSTVTLAQEGQVWYNTTSTVLKGFALNLPLGAWASGNNLIDDRPAAGSWGTQTAAAYVCGSPREQKTELFDGTSWTEGNDTQTARNYNEATGTPAAGLVFGGGVGGSPWATTASEEYDGTSWATGNPLVSVMAISTGFGIQTAAMCSAGSPTGGSDVTTNSQAYDGTSWSEGNNVNTGRMYVKASGTQASGLMASGSLHPSATRTADTEAYDGTCWSQVNDVNTARSAYGMTQVGANTGALIFCGATPGASNNTHTEIWDGTCWTEVADVATGTQELCGAGTNVAGLKMGGNAPTAPGGAVELWTSTTSATKTFTAT